MKVILKSDVERLGKAGDVVTVAAGYARNYLLPRGLALEATDRGMEQIEIDRRRDEKALQKKASDAVDLQTKLEEVSLTISKQSGESDKLFGTVTAMEIAEALEKEGHEIDKRKIELEEPIKTLGIYTVPIRLHSDVTAKVKLWVVKE
jgi:large subunit ribosomal protein L9